MSKTSIKSMVFRYGTFLFFIFLLLFFSVKSPTFLTVKNLTNILRQISIIGICTVGMTMVILCGGIDLPIGSVIALTSVILAKLLVFGVPMTIAFLITLLCGVLLGLINGFLINKIDMPPLIATLGTITIYRGLAYILAGGLSVFGFPPSFRLAGQGYVGSIPIQVIIQAVVYAIGFYLLYRTPFGRYVYGIGSNEKSSYLSGVHVTKSSTLCMLSLLH